MKTILKYPMAILFFAFVLGMFFVDTFNADRYYSEFENTVLQQKPTFSWQSFSDGTFGNQYVKYINDQFVKRDDWITMKATADMALGRTESHGVVYGKDGYLMEKLQIVEEKPSTAGTNVVAERTFDRSVANVRAFLEMYDKDVTLSIVPNSYPVLEDKVPYALPIADQEKYTQQIYDTLSQADNSLEVIDFTETLKEHSDEYIYYHTDHHWTTLGAYYAYVEYCQEKGLTPVSLSDLEENKVENFYGTFYSKAKRPGQDSDTITWYDVPVDEFAFVANTKEDPQLLELGEMVEEDGLQLLSVDSMMDERKFQTRDKYAAFMWGNSGYVKIKSSHNLDHQDGKTSRLLLFKDSYANSMIPYLTYNYDEIIVVDLRYMAKNVSELMKEDFDDIFVMYNFSTFISDISLANLKY